MLGVRVTSQSMRAYRVILYFLFAAVISTSAVAQVTPPPAPQRLTIHSRLLNEDRVVWVRMPAAAQPEKKENFPVLYITDAGVNVNEIGATIDFLADHNLMPPLIVVGIANTDRVRDLTPTNAGIRHSDGSMEAFPTSGGADKFLDFIEKELVPEIEGRYATQPYRVIAGHSLGGLFAVHALMSRPALFNAGVATSPSLWWDDSRSVQAAADVLRKNDRFNKALFVALGNESGDIQEAFERFRKVIATQRPKDFLVKTEHLEQETHRTTELLGYYHGLRFIFADWPMPIDAKTDLPVGGLTGVEAHYRALSARLGFPVSAERGINSLGYALLGEDKIDEAVQAFQRNAQLYPRSANVYDSLADAFEKQAKLDLALENVQKAVDLATESRDPLLPDFKKHLERLLAATRAGSNQEKRK